MSDKYASERFDPKVPTCGRASLSLYFDGQFLRLQGAKTPTQFSAVSGRLREGKFDYSVDNQKVPKQRPIPEGSYWIQPSELQENAWVHGAGISTALSCSRVQRWHRLSSRGLQQLH